MVEYLRLAMPWRGGNCRARASVRAWPPAPPDDEAVSDARFNEVHRQHHAQEVGMYVRLRDFAGRPFPVEDYRMDMFGFSSGNMDADRVCQHVREQGDVFR